MTSERAGERPQRFTQVPRPTLWLLPEDEIVLEGAPGESRIEVEVPPFYLSKGPVTNVQYEAFAPGHERAATSPGDDDPVVLVSWHEARAYCAWYAELSGKPFRLPTEVEWERACRDGGTGRWSWGDDAARSVEHAWTSESACGRAHEVETLKPNRAGVHDLLGNVWEWTASEHGPWPPSSAEPPSDDDAPGPRVLRGGSFRTPLAELSAFTRRAESPDARFDDAGFRIARSL